MVSLITTPTPIPCTYPQYPTSYLNFSPFSSVIFLLRPPRKRVQICRKAAVFDCVAGTTGGYFGFIEVGKERSGNSSLCCWCSKDCGSEGDSELEGKLLEFMEKSDKPEKFPTKEELVNAGRWDLVEDIRRRGGWFSLGWEVEDGQNEGEKVKENEIVAMDFDVEEFQRRVKSCEGSHLSGDDEVGPSDGDSFSGDSAQLASSSGRSLEMVTEEESGVQGILSRLEKERNSSLGITIGKYGNGRYASSKVYEDNEQFESSTDVDRVDPRNNGRLASSGTNKDSLYSHYTKPDMWRAWSNQQAGFQNSEFEAAEILYDRIHSENEGRENDANLIASKDASPCINRRKDINQDQIRIRLQELEVELSSTLRSLRSNREGSGSSSSELQKLSDSWEFQENEIMSSQERLRTIRAKLAVLEGKMALATIDAQKVVEEKQRRIDGAHKALQLLRTVHVVWPKSANEVLLAGSFDGWTTQRKMEKSSSGIFSVSLKLYPGRYEIKFIVDGVWRTDPLRPIIRNNGHENNLFIVS